jgi:hypothetical protein
MNSLDPQHVVWLNRGLALGLRLRGLKALLGLAQQALRHRSYFAHTTK